MCSLRPKAALLECLLALHSEGAPMTWRTMLAAALLIGAVLWLLGYLLTVTTWRAFDEGAPPDPQFVAASAGRAFIADMDGMPTTTSSTTTTVKPVVRSAPTVRAVSRPAPVVHDGSVWDRLAACESGGNWSINTGNGYYGGLQQDMQFWRSYGGPAFAARPDLASREQQIVVAERARDSGRGYRPWPTCARRLGLI